VEFRILGPLEVWHEDRLVHVGGTKERALLALLLLNSGEPVSADRLIDELWGDPPPPTARKSLQVRVAALRRAVGKTVLVTRGDAYLVILEQDQLDLHRFEHLVAVGDQALGSGDAAAALETFEDALALWRGPALADFAYESFAQAAIARLEELRLHTLELRIDAQLALGLHGRAVSELEGLVAAHPLRERLRGQLMLALYRDGRQAEALDVYRTTREQFLEELGIEPGPALRDLERAILRHDPSLDGAFAAATRSILVAPDVAHRALEFGGALAKDSRRELIIARLVAKRDDLAAAAALANQDRDHFVAHGVAARAITFTSGDVGHDLVRVATEQEADLLLVDGSAELADPMLDTVLARAPCDVAVHAGYRERVEGGPVVVLFAGAKNDWTAVELGAWIARAYDVPLYLVGPAEGAERDSSRALANASLAVQRVVGIPTEPVLVQPDAADVVAAASKASLVVVGIPERWRREGLGRVRGALVNDVGRPVLLVRSGLRPGGLAPRESQTRFTWTLAARA
jgi:DNA-binding SARP family transcriptional activator